MRNRGTSHFVGMLPRAAGTIREYFNRYVFSIVYFGGIFWLLSNASGNHHAVTKPATIKELNVWVNTDSHIYHYAWSPYFAATKNGVVMPVSKAKKAGNRAGRGPGEMLRPVQHSIPDAATASSGGKSPDYESDDSVPPGYERDLPEPSSPDEDEPEKPESD